MSNTRLGDANIAQLLKGTFIVLIALDLSSNSLGLCTMRALNQSSFPVLKHLCLANDGIDKLELEQLLTAPWPQLQSLDLSGNAFGNDAMVHFATGKLTALMSLNLSLTALTGVHGLAELMHNQGHSWQSLCCLTLDITLARPDVCSLLDLTYSSTTTSNSSWLELTRRSMIDLQILHTVAWPRLQRVKFM